MSGAPLPRLTDVACVAIGGALAELDALGAASAGGGTGGAEESGAGERSASRVDERSVELTTVWSKASAAVRSAPAPGPERARSRTKTLAALGNAAARPPGSALRAPAPAARGRRAGSSALTSGAEGGIAPASPGAQAARRSGTIL